jgi:CDP-glucose 4,6-dehydratase
VLLTGHTGFKGSWAAIWLHKLGAEVTGFSLEPEHEPSLYTQANVAQLCVSAIGDLRDAAAVTEVVKASRPDVVIHMAAQPIVRRSIEDPVESIAVNVLGTAHLLDAIRKHARPQAILVITSDKVYANDERGEAFKEGDQLGGKDPYSASKASAEIVTQSFARSYFDKQGVAAATARCGNIVGGGDYSVDRILPDALRAAEAGRMLVLRHPEATRPWLHVLDGVCGYLCFAEQLAAGAKLPKSLNFGPTEDQPLPVSRVADLMQATLGVTGGWRHEPVPGSIEMKALAVDSTLSRRTLGWMDRVQGDARIGWTADWHRAVNGGADARAQCLAQISAYSAIGGE